MKDRAGFGSKRAFFGFSSCATKTKTPLPSENCCSCRYDYGADGTTFVQFYPTLMPIAKNKSKTRDRVSEEVVDIRFSRRGVNFMSNWIGSAGAFFGDIRAIRNSSR